MDTGLMNDYMDTLTGRMDDGQIEDEGKGDDINMMNG